MEILFIVLVLGGLAVTALVVTVVAYYFFKGVRFFRRMTSGEMSEEDFRRMSDKYYYRNRQRNDGPQFDQDYFKGRGRTAGQQQQPRHTRTTRTSEGVTIVDRRDPSDRDKKIFARDEGEYVEFTE